MSNVAMQPSGIGRHDSSSQGNNNNNNNNKNNKYAHDRLYQRAKTKQKHHTIAELHGGMMAQRTSPQKVDGWVHRKPLSPDAKSQRHHPHSISELHGGMMAQRTSPQKVDGWVHRKPLSPDAKIQRHHPHSISELHGGMMAQRKSPQKADGWVHRKPLSPDYETIGKTSLLHGGLVQRTKTREEKEKYAETLREQMRLRKARERLEKLTVMSPRRKPQKMSLLLPSSNNNNNDENEEADVRNLLNKLKHATEKVFDAAKITTGSQGGVLPSPESSSRERRMHNSASPGSFARFQHNTSPKDERDIRFEARRKAKQELLARRLREQQEQIKQRKLQEKERERLEQEAFDRRIEAQRQDILRKQRMKLKEKKTEMSRNIQAPQPPVIPSPSSSSSSSRRIKRNVVVRESIRNSLPSKSMLVGITTPQHTVKSPMKIIHTTSTFVIPESSTNVYQSLPSRSRFDPVRSTKAPVQQNEHGDDGSETESGDDEEVEMRKQSPLRPPPATSKSLDGRFSVHRVSVDEIKSNRSVEREEELPSRSVSSPISATSVSSASKHVLMRHSHETNETRRSEDSISSHFRRRQHRQSPRSQSPQRTGRVLTLAQERALLKQEEEMRS